MATKKTVKDEIAEEIQAEQLKEIREEEAAAAMDDPWQQTVRMYVPKKPKGDDQQYYICINDRRFMVPANGKEQELPQPVAEVLMTSLKDEEAAEEYAEHIPHQA